MVPDKPRLLITASQHFIHVDAINDALAAVWWEWGCPRNAKLVVGQAAGGDTIAERIWRRRGLPVEPHPARWHEHADDCPTWHAGRAVCAKAGHRRNDYMVSLGADVCLAFIAACVLPPTRCSKRTPHGSHGSTATARKAKAAGIDTRPIVLDPLLREVAAELLAS